MSDTSANLSLPYLMPAQAQKHVTHNEALDRLDALVQAVVQDRDRAAPPAAPQPGDCHLVPAGAGGAWAGHAGEIALRRDSDWIFCAPRPGWRVHCLAEAADLRFTGSDWQPDPGPEARFERVGVNATPDGFNRLAVKAAATLLDHEGGGHQLKLNKAAPGQTASLLFQTGYSGRAEMGTAGGDGFALKVSADGEDWIEALRIDPATGAASGAAVNGSALGVSAGRLMRNGDHGIGGPAPALAGSTPLAARGLSGQAVRYDAATLPGGPEAAGAHLALALEGAGGRRVFLDFRNDAAGAPRLWAGRQQGDGAGAVLWAEILSQANAVGTVAHSGGQPAGALVETGSTATGRYLRLADGTQFCWHQMGLGSVAAQGSGTWAAPYRTAAASWTFPMPFAAPPAVTAQALLASTLTAARRMVQAQVGSDITATAAPDILAIRIGGDATADTPTVVLTAAGRWF